MRRSLIPLFFQCTRRFQSSSPLAQVISPTSTAKTRSTSSPSSLTQISFEDAFPQEHGGYRTVFTAADFQERLTLIEACLRTKQIHRAQVLFRNLCVTYPDLAARLIDVHVHNSFLEGFASHDGMGGKAYFKDALKWFNALKKSEIRPNLTSYVIMIRGALQHERSDVVKILVDDLKVTLRECKITNQDILRHPLIAEAEERQLARILRRTRERLLAHGRRLGVKQVLGLQPTLG